MDRADFDRTVSFLVALIREIHARTAPHLRDLAPEGAVC
jgi:hypothetical protein